MSFIIKTLSIGQLSTNCYLVIDSKTQEALIIDPGDSAEYISNVLRDEGATPVKIIATHGHFDHILAVTELRLAYNIPFYIHKSDEFLVKRMQSSAQHFLNIATDPPPEIDGFLKKSINVDKHVFEIIETPGHTLGSVCLYNKKENVLLTGDTIFANGGVGRTDFSYSSNKDLQKSLKKIFKLPIMTTIYPGHGASSTLKEEKVFHTF